MWRKTLLSESQESVDEVENIGQFADSDHSMLHWNICYENETRDEKSSSVNFDYAKGNYESCLSRQHGRTRRRKENRTSLVVRSGKSEAEVLEVTN